MMESVSVHVLTSLFLDAKGAVTSRNVGATFSLHEAEAHRAKGVENEFETFQIDADWQEAAATSALVEQMRAFRDLIAEQHEEALR